ncbi:MAG: FtsK/SpoIIIE domain-containing protein [Ruminococcus sp.]
MLDNYNNKDLHNMWNTKIVFLYILGGTKKIINNYKLLFAFGIYLITILLIWLWISFVHTFKVPFLQQEFDVMVAIISAALIMLITIVVLILIGKPKGAKSMSNNLHRIGLVNQSQEAPVLVERTKSKDNSRMEILTFISYGIPVQKWTDNQEKIESALNIRIDTIEEGKNCRQVVVRCVSGKYRLPDKLMWNKGKISDKDSELVLGESITSTVTVDLSKVPHILIGGSTGSGKSVLLKLLLMQCVVKGSEVYIADFKGGVDFPPVWHEKCEIITDQEKLLNILDEVVEELQSRKILLCQSACHNIDDYNNNSIKNPLHRIVIGCDEIAEVLDKTGLDKAQKELVGKIEMRLSIIARQGRAFGIHLVIATQRPDANILCGQIRNNIDMRICGRADDVLSKIILDNTDASDKIPKTSQGRFLTNTGVVFQAYLFDDTKLIELI